MGMPRRVAQYRPEFQFWNDVCSIASFVLAASTLIFLYAMFSSLTRGKKAPPNPWNARTLEWQISSPPPYYNFKQIPAVLKNPYDFGEPLPYLGLDPSDKEDRRQTKPPGGAPPEPAHA
jgi:cytochrome c oxidase subunit 1